LSLALTTLSATNLCDATGTPLPRGVAYFDPVHSDGTPVEFEFGGTPGGEASSRTVSTQVLAGAFTINLADTLQTRPVNIGYKVRVVDSSTGEVVNSYPFVQPAGATFNFDTYDPTTPPRTTGLYAVALLCAANGVTYALSMIGPPLDIAWTVAPAGTVSVAGIALADTVIPDTVYLFQMQLNVHGKDTYGWIIAPSGTVGAASFALSNPITGIVSAVSIANNQVVFD
jgi:hypothetical protein